MVVVLTVLMMAIAACQGQEETCRPMGKKTSSMAIALQNPDAIILQVKMGTKLPKMKKGQTYYVDATVHKAFAQRSGGLKKKAKIQIGPVGKSLPCAPIKKKKRYFVFLEHVSENKYRLLYNPEKRPKEIKRVKKELLCKNCKLSPPVMKENVPSSIGLVEWLNTTLQIMCKWKKSNPKPKLAWYLDGEKLKEVENQVVITTTKSSSSLVIHPGSEFLRTADYECRAENGVGEPVKAITRVRYTPRCSSECAPEADNGFCQNDGLCCNNENHTSHYCLCQEQHTGTRCTRRVIPPVNEDKVTNVSKTNATAILGMATALLLVALLIVVTYFLSDRKSRRDGSSGSRRKQLYSIEGHEDELDGGSAQTIKLTATRFETTNSSKSSTPRQQRPPAAATASLSPQPTPSASNSSGGGGGSILDQIRASPRPSLTSLTGSRDHVKRSRLNATAKGAATTKSPSSSSPPAARYDKTATRGSSDDDELVFPPPVTSHPGRNAAVVTCRPHHLTAPLLRQNEIDDGDEEDDGMTSSSSSGRNSDVSEERMRLMTSSNHSLEAGAATAPKSSAVNLLNGADEQ